jgi:hypothetical protein
MEVVQKHDADTLLPIIERIACPGSIIHSDQWRVYHGQRFLNAASVVYHATFFHPNMWEEHPLIHLSWF